MLTESCNSCEAWRFGQENCVGGKCNISAHGSTKAAFSTFEWHLVLWKFAFNSETKLLAKNSAFSEIFTGNFQILIYFTEEKDAIFLSGCLVLGFLSQMFFGGEIQFFSVDEFERKIFEKTMKNSKKTTSLEKTVLWQKIPI